MPRFVLLHHETSDGSHCDLMLEAGGVLKTWSLAASPESERPMVCRALPDHRLAYLDYEGPVSGNRGHVVRCDEGVYEVVEQTPARWVVELRGQTLQGLATLTSLQGDAISGRDTVAGNVGAEWQLLYERRATQQ